ncbi:MAG: DMT family transporter [Paracoccaceae bacterium]|nr:DMT family transporter [Paracoccaceae bacterium]
MNDRVVLGIGLMLMFCATAPMLDVMAKLAAASIPVGQITTMRFLGQAALMLPVCLFLGHHAWPERAHLPLLTWRAIFLILSTYAFVAAIQVMPIADALAIAFVEPFLILLMGKFFFGEEVGPRRLAAAAVGFVGVLMVIQPSFEAFGAVALFPLGTAVFFAAYMIVTRRLSRHVHPVPMQFQTALVALVICLPVMGLADIRGWPTLDPVMPEGIFWLWMLGVGVFATLSHMFMTYALRFAPSATLAPLHYLEIVSAVILGFLVFGDFPNTLALTGIGVILAAGLYVIHRERKLEMVKRMPLPAQP